MEWTGPGRGYGVAYYTPDSDTTDGDGFRVLEYDMSQYTEWTSATDIDALVFYPIRTQGVNVAGHYWRIKRSRSIIRPSKLQ